MNSTSKNLFKCFQKILKKFVDDRVGVASMLDNFHVERSSNVSSVKKTNLGCHFVVTFCLRFVFLRRPKCLTFLP